VRKISFGDAGIRHFNDGCSNISSSNFAAFADAMAIS
jgi:hypothetical protein